MSIFDLAENEKVGFGGKGRSASQRVQALIFLLSSEAESLRWQISISLLCGRTVSWPNGFLLIGPTPSGPLAGEADSKSSLSRDSFLLA